MSPNTPSVNVTACRMKRVHCSHRRARCELCGRFAPRAWETSRTAIDIDLDGSVFLLVTVGVHRCRHCNRHFRVQPPFLRKGAVYTERVREKAVLSVYEDGMAIRRVANRLARDFWVSPSEAMIRRWCREYAESLDFSGDYQSWVVEEFSGVLCVDEVYQGELALLLAPEEILAEEGPDANAPSEIPQPPSPWSDWEQVRKVRKLLWECRYVMLRRPDHLSEEHRENLRYLLKSPVGEQVGLMREFLEEWYTLFHDEHRDRRSPEEAKNRYERLRHDERYRALKPLGRLQARLGEEHFEKISSFLRRPQWEATNNAAERGARAFRHLQAPRYNLRSSQSIDDAIKVRAWLSRRQDNAARRSSPPGRCARGRKAGRTRSLSAAA